MERTLRGEGDLIKERTIGTDVFDREASYDTSTDHVVRSATAEVRRRLAQYYQDCDDEVTIELRPGSYVPRFTVRQ